MSRTFGECADGQMTAHGMRGNSETAFTPDTSQRWVFFFLAALLWRRRSVGEWPGRAFSYVIFSLCAWGSLWHGAAVGTRMRRRQDRCV